MSEGQLFVFSLLYSSLDSSPFFTQVRKTNVKNEHIVGIMIFEFFIIPSLGFYIFRAISIDFRSDGQLIMETITTFPLSSFGFLGLGIFIDTVKLKSQPEMNIPP